MTSKIRTINTPGFINSKGIPIEIILSFKNIAKTKTKIVDKAKLIEDIIKASE
jgi:hypothetical protein